MPIFREQSIVEEQSFFGASAFLKYTGSVDQRYSIPAGDIDHDVSVQAHSIGQVRVIEVFGERIHDEYDFNTSIECGSCDGIQMLCVVIS